MIMSANETPDDTQYGHTKFAPHESQLEIELPDDQQQEGASE